MNAMRDDAMLRADLSGKVALVTGASGGLGRHFALTLARNGATVVVAARRIDSINAVAAEIAAAGGQSAAVVLDVTSSDSVRAAFDQAQARFEAVDILVNNSGIVVGKPALEQSPEDWNQVLETNLRGAFFMATECARRLRDAKRPGSIINIASILGLRQASMVASYAASKAALIQLTKTLALELARYDIRVNAIAPGYIESDLNRDFFATEAGQALVRRIPQRRLGSPHDLDGPLLLLASQSSRYMTGSVIVADGGHLTSSL